MQRAWDDVGVKRIQNALLEGSSGVNMARLRAVLRIEAGAWLHALPSPHMETLLNDGSLRIAVAPGLQGLRMPFLCLRLCGGGRWLLCLNLSMLGQVSASPCPQLRGP